MKAIRIAMAGALTATALATFGASATATGPYPGPDRPQSIDQSLRDLGKRHDLRIGTAVDMSALANDATYRDMAGSEFSAVTAENVMKWEVLEPQRGTYDWTAADQLVAFARAHGQRVHGHTLLWHNQLPGWLTAGVADGSIDAEELRGLLRTHIIDVVSHFRGKIWHWDVVNEVIDDNAQLRDTIWLRQLGPGYIADAFRWAREADPRVKLYLNDYNIEGVNAKSDAYYDLVKRLRGDGVPVAGIGIQGHLGTQYGPPTNAPENFLRFDALGLETAVTEADVRSVMPIENPEISAQSHGFSLLLQACLITPRCVMFTVWGFTDRYQWVSGFFDGQGWAAPFDENFAPKPAYQQMRVDLALANGPRKRDR